MIKQSPRKHIILLYTYPLPIFLESSSLVTTHYKYIYRSFLGGFNSFIKYSSKDNLSHGFSLGQLVVYR